MQVEVQGIKRMRRFACVTLGMTDRHTDTDVRLDLIERLVGEVLVDMHSWMDAQVVALHDACQTLEVRNRQRDD